MKFFPKFGVLGAFHPPTTGVGLASGKSFAAQAGFSNEGRALDASTCKACNPSMTPPPDTLLLLIAPELVGSPGSSSSSSNVGRSVPSDAVVDPMSMRSGSSARLKARAVR